MDFLKALFGGDELKRDAELVAKLVNSVGPWQTRYAALQAERGRVRVDGVLGDAEASRKELQIAAELDALESEEKARNEKLPQLYRRMADRCPQIHGKALEMLRGKLPELQKPAIEALTAIGRHLDAAVAEARKAGFPALDPWEFSGTPMQQLIVCFRQMTNVVAIVSENLNGAAGVKFAPNLAPPSRSIVDERAALFQKIDRLTSDPFLLAEEALKAAGVVNTSHFRQIAEELLSETQPAAPAPVMSRMGYEPAGSGRIVSRHEVFHDRSTVVPMPEIQTN